MDPIFKGIFDNFFESMAAVRKLEQEGKIDPEEVELHYEEIYNCPAGDGLILDKSQAFRDAGGQYYHNDQCAAVTDMEAGA